MEPIVTQTRKLDCVFSKVIEGDHAFRVTFCLKDLDVRIKSLRGRADILITVGPINVNLDEASTRKRGQGRLSESCTHRELRGWLRRREATYRDCVTDR